MNYLRRINDITILDGKKINTKATIYLSHYLLQYFKDIKSLIKNTKRILKINKCVPLYVYKDILLIQVTSIKDPYYIVFNYYEVKKYDILNEKTIITFLDDTKLELIISKYRIKYLLNNARKVDEYLSLL